MPTATYGELLAELAPSIIETEKQYFQLLPKLGDLVGKGRKRTAEETKLMRLLSLLIEDYDGKHAEPAESSTPAERLRYLLEVSGKAPADLLPVFGQRSHVNEALNGKRSVSAAQARKLGSLFRLNPGYFL